MATYRDPVATGRGRRGVRPEDDRRPTGDDDYTRQLADRYGHGNGGYDRDAYRQGGYGEVGPDHGGLDRDAPRGARGSARESDSIGREFAPRRAYRDRGHGEGLHGDERVSTGVFGGGADQDTRSGGQYQGESGRGAQGGYGGDFSGGGYLGRGTGARPQRDARSGGAFGEDPRGSYGPEGSSRAGGDEDRSRAFAQPGGGFRGRGPRNYTRSDQRITEDLCERLTEADDIDASGIEVQVSQGMVTLSGTVGERWMKHRAEDMAEACGGVRDVENLIRVQRDEGRTGSGAAAGRADPSSR